MMSLLLGFEEASAAVCDCNISSSAWVHAMVQWGLIQHMYTSKSSSHPGVLYMMQYAIHYTTSIHESSQWCWMHQQRCDLSTHVLHLCMLIVFKYILENNQGRDGLLLMGFGCCYYCICVASFSHRNPFMSVNLLILLADPWCLPNSLF